MSDNIFEIATRKKFRYQTNRGVISVEQLWELPLTANGGFNLDNAAKEVNAQLKAANEESFVATATSANTELQMKLDVVKRIIEVKLAEVAKATKRLENRKTREQILDALAARDQADLAAAPREELLKQLAEVED